MEYKFLFPMLTCGECCFPHSKTLISVGDGDYLNSNRSTNRWYDGVFISSFAQLAAHYAHLTVSERSRVLGDSYKQPLLLHVTYPNQILQEGEYKALPDHVTKGVAVMHDRDHYAVMEINIPVKKVVIFDRLYKDLKKWMDHVVSGMKQCMLLDLNDTFGHRLDEPSISNVGGSRHPQKAIHGYSLFLGLEEWKLERGDFIKQMVMFYCGPIACLKILEPYSLTALYEVNLAYNTNSIWSFVISECTWLVAHCNNDLILCLRECVPLLEPWPEDGATPTAAHRSYLTIDGAVAAAAAASDDAPKADMGICFFCCDSLAMQLVRLICCKKMIHRQCLLAYLGTNSQCCYCGCPVDMAKLMEYETIHRSLPQSLTPVKTPKHNLQQMLMDKKTPLRDADCVRSELHEKKHMAQITQANRMICQQGKYIENQGGSPGAVVVVQVDYQAVSHAIGIVDVIYQIASTGGAWIATVAGLLSTGSKKANRWIPSDKYVIKYRANNIANIAPELGIIQQSILSGEYNDNNAKRCTIQEVHQVITEAISPCRKSTCNCVHGV